MIIFPAFPVYTISIGGVIATKIQSIEIWRMTRAVAPGAFEGNGAVAVSVMIIIVILVVNGRSWGKEEIAFSEKQNWN